MTTTLITTRHGYEIHDIDGGTIPVTDEQAARIREQNAAEIAAETAMSSDEYEAFEDHCAETGPVEDDDRMSAVEFREFWSDADLRGETPRFDYGQ